MTQTCTIQPRQRGAFAGIVLIVVGTLLLLVKTGVIERAIVAQWWPLGMIAAGAWLAFGRRRRE